MLSAIPYNLIFVSPQKICLCFSKEAQSTYKNDDFVVFIICMVLICHVFSFFNFSHIITNSSAKISRSLKSHLVLINTRISSTTFHVQVFIYILKLLEQNLNVHSVTVIWPNKKLIFSSVSTDFRFILN